MFEPITSELTLHTSARLSSGPFPTWSELKLSSFSSRVGATDLRELWADVDFLNETFQEIGDAGPGVDAVGSVQNDDDVQLLRTL